MRSVETFLIEPIDPVGDTVRKVSRCRFSMGVSERTKSGCIGKHVSCYAGHSMPMG